MTVTTARAQIFEIIDAAYYQGVETILTRNGKEIAKIVPLEKKQVDWGKRLVELKKLMPTLTNEDIREIEQVRSNSRIKRFPQW